eukprot:364899-Chlamydomonas_euryale.AAC.4
MLSKVACLLAAGKMTNGRPRRFVPESCAVVLKVLRASRWWIAVSITGEVLPRGLLMQRGTSHMCTHSCIAYASLVCVDALRSGDMSAVEGVWFPAMRDSHT